MRKYLTTTTATIPVLSLLALAGCVEKSHSSSDKKAAQKSEQVVQQIDQQTGFPSITNGFEKRMVRMLYELRDNPEYRTYSYIVTLNGRFIKICDSIGYGINSSIQFSNPDKLINTDLGQFYGNMAMPQAEPNGLFMPEGLAATYVMCLDGKELKPVYVEPEVVVSPFPMEPPVARAQRPSNPVSVLTSERQE